MADPQRVLTWLRRLARARADRVEVVPGGWALRHTRFPSAHDHNLLLLWEPVDVADVLATAERVFGDAGLAYRRVHVQDGAVADALGPGLLAQGYAREDELVMEHAPAAGTRVLDLRDPSDLRPVVSGLGPVVDLGLEERVAAVTDGWRRDQPDSPPQVHEQLGERVLTLLDAVEATFLAVRQGDRVVAHADLYVADRVAQIEEVVTEVESRNHGCASALVREAVARATRSRVDVVFLVADADDWPALLYGRLGFVELTRTVTFVR